MCYVMVQVGLICKSLSHNYSRNFRLRLAFKIHKTIKVARHKMILIAHQHLQNKQIYLFNSH